MQDFLKGYSENPLIADLNPSLPIFESVKDGMKARVEDEYNRIQNNRVVARAGRVEYLIAESK